MTQIAQEDLIRSVADALQFISYYHPVDYIAALGEAYAREESPAAKDAIAQILTNSRMCAEDTARYARTPASSSRSCASAWTSALPTRR
jgi:tartrate dehydratase alpha subunit/fumarate hydratase class I-like protein